MRPTMDELGIGNWTAEDRLALAEEIWASVATEVEATPLTEAEHQEVDRRLATHRANPDAAIPCEQVEAVVSHPPR